MTDTPQQISNFPGPAFNPDKLEGAIQHMLMICGSLSDAALDVFSVKYALERGKKLPENYASKILIPKMKRAGRIWQTSKHLYSINPVLRHNQKGLDAFWVFLENMADVDLATVMSGPQYPCQLSYIKNKKIYHIVRCEKEGSIELGMAVQLEMAMEARKKNGESSIDTERYFFIFSSEEYMNAAPYTIKTPSLFGVINYKQGSIYPTLSFANPTNR